MKRWLLVFALWTAPALAQYNPLVYSQVTCGTSATLVWGDGSSYVSRQISNQSGGTVYLGGSTVTTSSGFPVPSGSGYDATHALSSMYCVATSAAVIGTLQY